ncbi:MAG: SDR family NAD(P)-dependent oxidoreductase [Chloroflexota bacterium]|nr:SDR family NAD(P)-dependent oxidoreductase [Chloroflexota bacterium]
MSAPERDLAGKVAIVTGAGSGVGRATALALAGAGAAPVLVGRTRERLEETARLVEEIGGTALVVAADVSDEAAVAGVVEQAMAELGGVDVLVAAAGVGLYGPVESYPLAAWQATLAVNLTGVFLCSQAVLPALRARGGGAILAIASGSGKQGYPNLAAYAASKFGLIGFMQSLAAEVGDEGIKVSTIVPGSILTDFAGGSAANKRSQSEGKRYLEPEDVAEAVLYLLRQPARAWTQEMNLWPF